MRQILFLLTLGLVALVSPLEAAPQPVDGVNGAVPGDADISALTDELSDTVDYVHLNLIVEEEMAIRSKLLEHVAERILNRIFKELIIVTEATVAVSKINPPIGGDVQMVTIERSKKR